MIDFNCDYAEGAHEKIVARLMETNRIQTPGYGEDDYCKEAADTICRLCEKESAAVHFLVGGTQTNLTVISAALRPHQGVVAAECGHIAVHESGAIEATGHKVLPLCSVDGKITAEQLRKVYRLHYEDTAREHTVQPKMVYLSQPTEYGAIYQLEELQEISRVCTECGWYLYVDGARLAYGLMAQGNTVSLPDLAKLCDVFYIGGTKCGALFGEAVVILNPALQEDFRYVIKQKGGMLAKGRLLGIQFGTLLADGLYEQIGSHGNRLAMRIREAMMKKGWKFYADSVTNQQFPIISNELLAKIGEKYRYSYTKPWDEQQSVVRFCTSWATREEDVEELIKDIQAL